MNTMQRNPETLAKSSNVVKMNQSQIKWSWASRLLAWQS